jgi:hypothetical protein
MTEAYDKGRADERAAVIAWLVAVAFFGEKKAPGIRTGDAVKTDTGALCVVARLLELGRHVEADAKPAEVTHG